MTVIVNSPQFDQKALAPGTAVRVTTINERNEWYGFDCTCLVTHNRKLSLKLICVDREGKVDYKELPVQLVADGQIKVTVLEKPKTETQEG